MSGTSSSNLASDPIGAGHGAGLMPRSASLAPWFSSVTRLKGVGEAVAAALMRLIRPLRPPEVGVVGVPLLRDLLFHLPVGVQDRRRVTPVAALQKGQYVTLDVRVVEHVPPPPHKPRFPYRVVTVDDVGDTLTLTFFRVKGDYLLRQLQVGGRYYISGTVDVYNQGYQTNFTLAHPDDITPFARAAEALRLVPIYGLTAGISHKMLQKLTTQAVQHIALHPLPEWHDGPLMQQRGWPSIGGALQQLHAPTEAAMLEGTSPARMRLAYDELLANQLALALSRRSKKRQPTQPIPHNAALHKKLEAALPFTLTAGQQSVLAEVFADMASGERMARLVQGDVGSGKTIVAFAAMLQAVGAGQQACFMAPTDLLARQHLASLAPLAETLGVRIALLSGKMKKPEQARIRAALEAGEIDMLLGTHALFQEGVLFDALALVVVDEQHRFGVQQRMRLTCKGLAPHVLQMTATPIPRSLAMTLYGDMEVSVLNERPAGRKPIDTRAIPEDRVGEVIAGLRRVLEAGERAYWVCPVIEPSEMDEAAIAAQMDQPPLVSAEERFALLNQFFPDKVGLIHGKMKLPEREAVMQDFANGVTQLLVATTVVEVGVDVREATVMVIEHAERFGLAQLHQLRGRVGRNDQQSRCILLYHRLSAIAKDRLRILRETNDGFRIAEEDLRLRGAGDLLGTRQTGLPDFALVDMAAHVPLIRMAHDDAKLMLHQDPQLTSPRGVALQQLLALFEYERVTAV